MECFWIIIIIIIKANQKIGEIPFTANKIQSKNKQTAQSAGQCMRRSRGWL